jgi:NADPH:quinone reductase-like Zn-dependent oxidoreductase
MNGRRWIIPTGSTSGTSALRLINAPIPGPGPGEVLVRVHATSLNYRDGAVVMGRYFSGAVKVDTVPLSDGAGEVIAVGAGVTQWQPGDRVAGCFFQNWTDGPFTAAVLGSDLGGPQQGMLADYVVLSETGLVAIPEHLSFAEAATLPCAALTAWNALFEIANLGTGQTVLTLGTGGVSVFAAQFAAAAGARVIATSSSDAKLDQLRRMGVTDTINYRTKPDWDAEVLRLTNSQGVDAVIEVGGAGTLPRSLNAVRPGGTVALIGVLSGAGSMIDPLPLIGKAIRLQGTYVGSLAMFQAMNAFLAKHRITPVIDRSFAFADAPDAYAYQASAAHFGKIVILHNT